VSHLTFFKESPRKLGAAFRQCRIYVGLARVMKHRGYVVHCYKFLTL
jgi:hypothetical protein